MYKLQVVIETCQLVEQHSIRNGIKENGEMKVIWKSAIWKNIASKNIISIMDVSNFLLLQ